MITNGNISNPSPGREIKDKSVKKKHKNPVTNKIKQIQSIQHYQNKLLT
jgi:hypothetical protein